jgi:hypothetical protein
MSPMEQQARDLIRAAAREIGRVKCDRRHAACTCGYCAMSRAAKRAEVRAFRLAANYRRAALALLIKARAADEVDDALAAQAFACAA